MERQRWRPVRPRSTTPGLGRGCLSFPTPPQSGSFNHVTPQRPDTQQCLQHWGQLTGLKVGMLVAVTLSHPVKPSPRVQGDPHQQGAPRALPQGRTKEAPASPPPPPSTGPNMRGWSPAELPRGRDESGPIWLPTLGPEPGPHRCRHLGAKTPSGHRMSCQGERRPGKTASRQDSGYGPSSRSPTQNGGGSVTSKPVWETNVGDAINHRAAHPKLRPKTAYTPRNP